MRYGKQQHGGKVSDVILAGASVISDMVAKLPIVTDKPSNIIAATTAEDMITKFNDLLADLKAKGYMEVDV